MIIAPCGINCSLCRVFNREKDSCPGCRSLNGGKPGYCTKCIIRNCENLDAGGYCYTCDRFPCKRLKALDKRYRTKYDNPLVDNLILIRDLGLEFFRSSEHHKWECPQCGGLICIHTGICLNTKKKDHAKKQA
jgi:hypothetical protein